MAALSIEAIGLDTATQGWVTIRLAGIYKYFSGVPALRDVSVEF